MLFVLKKIVSRLAFPVPLSLELIVLGLILLWFTRRQRAGKVLVTVGVLLLLALGSGIVSTGLLAPLENRYPPYGLNGQYAVPESDIRYVVVLAGAWPSVEGYPITRQIGGDAWARLVEGVRVFQRCPNSTLVLLGGRGVDAKLDPNTFTNMIFVRFLGVDPARVVALNVGQDTESEARAVAPLVGSSPMVLVTSASHMPRAMGIYRKCGMSPVPAPTGYATALVNVWVPEAMFPSSDSLMASERAIYEYLGMLWQQVKSRI
jgi:uncharacterized SAM-binding protein YcdF (DUF218 family)